MHEHYILILKKKTGCVVTEISEVFLILFPDWLTWWGVTVSLGVMARVLEVPVSVLTVITCKNTGSPSRLVESDNHLDVRKFKIKIKNIKNNISIFLFIIAISVALSS